MTGSLSDLVVVEAGTGWPISLAGRMFAELGATVVKLEPPEGDALRHAGPIHADGLSYAWHTTCAGKRSVVIDPQSDTDLRFLRDLVPASDIVLSDGVSFDVSPPRSPSYGHLIFAYLTPFGMEPPTNWQSGCEGVLQAAAGIMSTTGLPGGPPVRTGAGLGDAVGAYYSVSAILAALLHRDSTGHGQTVDIAFNDCLITFLLLWLPKFFLTGEAPQRQGNRHLSSIPWNAYATVDGWVMLCTSTDAQWLRLCDLMERGDLKGGVHDTLRGRLDDAAFVDGLVAKWVVKFTTAQISEILNRAGIPVGPIMSVAEMLADPHTLARGIVAEIPDHVGGTVRIAGPLCKMSDTPGKLSHCGPKLNVDRGFVDSALPTWLACTKRGLIANAPSLDQIRVAESGVFGAGPFATKLMAELGMQVVKLEAPEGDGMRHYHPQVNGTAYPFHLYNANKHSLCVDLKKPEDVARTRALLAKTDVYLENLGPGVVDRLGLGYEDVRDVNPRLVYCSVSGFGKTGPYAGNRAYDTVIQAMSGIMSVTGFEGPVKIGVSAADLLGPTFACASILAALHYRNRGGAGQRIDVSMHDVCSATTQALWPLVWRDGAVPRIGNAHPFYAPYGTYSAQDGEIFVGVETDEQWRSLARLLKLSSSLGILDGDARVRERSLIDEALSSWIVRHSAFSAVNSLQASGVPAASICGIAAVVAAKRTSERGMFVQIQDEHGTPLTFTGSPFKMTLTPGRVVQPAPALDDMAAQAAARTNN
jgi:crotonobetainyl-CoA:carnitine CoA-transferase CaiB-like acyl-CoA transferase